MPSLYQQKSCEPRANAQLNLAGRTHYVDSDTLRFHKARILSAHDTCNGLVFYVIESVALDPENRKRGVRYVLFDIFGHVISKVALADCWRVRQQAHKAMHAELNTLDAVTMTRLAIQREERAHASEMHTLRGELARIAELAGGAR